LKGKTQDITLRRTRFGRGYGLVRHKKNERTNESKQRALGALVLICGLIHCVITVGTSNLFVCTLFHLKLSRGVDVV
jgi:hypothetical protein